ncbi:S1 RNA-binding domain-containing protein [Caviibacter abscessus]|uniref:S1 RNA-binding domain-containing protein n=1 Tax=Caviibacter abscessus TaxID=1766719 RepID=UPI00082DE54C|nr:S1 RNA-binding domain-containing protein [Caviibacter abscessus]
MTNNVDFEKLLADYLPCEFKSGTAIEGTITRKEMEYSYLDINNKLEGRIRSFEIEDLNVGDTIAVQVIKTEDDYIIVSKLALDRIKEFDGYNVGDIVTGTVQKQIKGGYNVKIKSLNAFLPLSLSGAKDKEIIGKTFDFLIKEKTKKGITISRTDLTKKEISDFLETINLNDVVKCTISEILDFGVIVKLGPTTGLIHISELTWNQIKDISDILKVGQEIEAKIIEINKEKAKIKLSIKQLTDNPWFATREKYQLGELRTGTIKEILDFGLVISIDNTEDEGFMHISDISYRKYFKLDKTFKIGDTIEFEILNINDEKQRISLSAKALLDKTWDTITDNLNIGDIVEAKVIFAQDYGMFVELPNKLEAFIRRIDYSWTKNELTEFNEGENIKFVITNIDADNKKIAGSIKALIKSPWKEAIETYKIGNIVEVTITDKIDSGLLVELTPRFKGLIPTREIDKDYSISDKVKAVIIDENESKNSIILSIRRIKENEEKKELDKLMEKYGVK